MAAHYKWSKIIFPKLRGESRVLTPITTPLLATAVYAFLILNTKQELTTHDNLVRMGFEALNDVKVPRDMPISVLNYYTFRQYHSYEEEMENRIPFPFEKMTPQQKREWYLERFMDPKTKIRM
jgi:hypothetical protein